VLGFSNNNRYLISPYKPIHRIFSRGKFVSSVDSTGWTRCTMRFKAVAEDMGRGAGLPYDALYQVSGFRSRS
jgi:hypothetical protein